MITGEHGEALGRNRPPSNLWKVSIRGSHPGADAAWARLREPRLNVYALFAISCSFSLAPTDTDRHGLEEQCRTVVRFRYDSARTATRTCISATSLRTQHGATSVHFGIPRTGKLAPSGPPINHLTPPLFNVNMVRYTALIDNSQPSASAIQYPNTGRRSFLALADGEGPASTDLERIGLLHFRDSFWWPCDNEIRMFLVLGYAYPGQPPLPEWQIY